MVKARKWLMGNYFDPFRWCRLFYICQFLKQTGQPGKVICYIQVTMTWWICLAQCQDPFLGSMDINPPFVRLEIFQFVARHNTNHRQMYLVWAMSGSGHNTAATDHENTRCTVVIPLLPSTLQRTVYSVQCTVYSVQCTVYCGHTSTTTNPTQASVCPN